jgi:hypothetical protein
MAERVEEILIAYDTTEDSLIISEQMPIGTRS